MCGSFFYLESAAVLLNIHYLEVKIILILTINIFENRFFFQPQTTECKQEGTWIGTLMAEMWGSEEGGQLPGHKTCIHGSLCCPGRAVHFYKV